MYKIIFFLLLCSCASNKVDIRYAKLEIPKIELNIDELKLTECKSLDIKEILINDIQNITIIRNAYNKLLLSYKNDIEYYNAVIDAFNQDGKE